MYQFSHPAVEFGRNTWGGMHDVVQAGLANVKMSNNHFASVTGSQIYDFGTPSRKSYSTP